MSIDCFLSFANSDWPEIAPLHARMKMRGIELRIVKERPEASTAWHETVRRAIEMSPAIVLAVSPDWVRSPPCAYELGLARGVRRPVLALVDLSRAMTVPVLPSVLRAPDVELINAGHSVAQAVEAIAGRLRSTNAASTS